jgi:hypothetical protein
MFDFLRLLCGALVGLFRSSARRETEILVLRHQINVLRRQSPRRPALDNVDRLLFVWLARLVPATLRALAVVTPETWFAGSVRAFGPFGAINQDRGVGDRRHHSRFANSFET